MFKVKGTLSNSKAFAFDAQANTLADAFNEMNKKLTGKLPPNTEITRVSFQKRGAIVTDVILSDVKKRTPKK